MLRPFLAAIHQAPPSIVAPIFFLAAGLLAAGGLAKARAPIPTVRALGAARIQVGPPAVRALGAIEVAAGVAGLAAPGRPVALVVAAMYLAFATFLAWLLFRGAEASSCGCLGRRDAPPSWLHVGLNLAAVAAALALALQRSAPPNVVRFAWGLPFHGAGFVAGLVLAGSLAYLTVAFLPRLFLSYRP
jgi:methylamine utilization protein MauE